MYITKEVEIWLNNEDLGEFVGEELSEVLPLAAVVEQLHDEYHSGPVLTCSHPACHSARESLKAAREFAERYRIEDPSIAALHAYGDKLRRDEERQKGVYRFPGGAR